MIQRIVTKYKFWINRIAIKALKSSLDAFYPLTDTYHTTNHAITATELLKRFKPNYTIEEYLAFLLHDAGHQGYTEFGDTTNIKRSKDLLKQAVKMYDFQKVNVGTCLAVIEMTEYPYEDHFSDICWVYRAIDILAGHMHYKDGNIYLTDYVDVVDRLEREGYFQGLEPEEILTNTKNLIARVSNNVYRKNKDLSNTLNGVLIELM